jgi:hypothetical protein
LLDFAHGLEYGPGHGVAATIVDAFIAALSDDVEQHEAEAVLAALITSVNHPGFWLRLLVAARYRPHWHVPVAAALASGALLANTETRAAAGELMQVLSTTMEPEQHRRLLEEPIERAAELFSPDHAQWRDRAIDQLLGYLDVSRLQNPALRERLAALLAGGEPSRAPGPSRFISERRALDLAEVLGPDTYDALDDDARAALDQLRLALNTSERNTSEPDGPDTTARLQAALEAAVATAGDVTAGRVREFVTRGAERLACSSTVVPGTEIGELVVGLLLEAASRAGAER